MDHTSSSFMARGRSEWTRPRGGSWRGGAPDDGRCGGLPGLSVGVVPEDGPHQLVVGGSKARHLIEKVVYPSSIRHRTSLDALLMT